LVEAGQALLAPLGPVVGEYCADLHRQAGVELVFGETVARFDGGTLLEQVLLAGGRTLPCELALVCVGAEPNSELAGVAGLEVDFGVVVDEFCRSSDGSIFAAGDVASRWSPRWNRRLRLEHYDNAHLQGLHVGGAMLGDATIYDPVPYFWTEQYDAMVQMVGVFEPEDRAVLRGEPGSGRFSVFYLRQGSISACVAVNRFQDLSAARRLIESRIPVAEEMLSKASLDLRAWSIRAAEEVRDERTYT
jgi:3-phenylpropionate/trans-cinnamate dioxygenase ferredoxin reductase subunit